MDTATQRHVITATIAITIFVVVMAVYWDRQNQRYYELAQQSLQAKAAEDAPPPQRTQPRQRTNVKGFQPRLVAFSKVSYKDIVAAIAPSVVSVNTGTAPGGPANQIQQVAAQTPPGTGQQGTYLLPGEDLGKYILQPPGMGWGRRGGPVPFSAPGAARQGGRAQCYICPNCYTRMPSRAGMTTNGVGCPSCGMRMAMAGATAPIPYAMPPMTPGQGAVTPNAGTVQPGTRSPAAAPAAIAQPQAPAQTPPVPGTQPANQSPAAVPALGKYVRQPLCNWAGAYLVCPSCGIGVPHQTGVPAYAVGCPGCGTRMLKEGTPVPCPLVPGAAAGAQPAPDQPVTASPQAQQVAAQVPQGRRFQQIGRGGSGVIVNRRGYVLSNHHVVHGARNIRITVCSGQVSKTYPAEIVDEAPGVDMVILRILANGNETFVPAPIGNSAQLSVGDEVLAMGSPFGLQQSVTFGIVSNTRRTLAVDGTTFPNVIQTDAPMNPGSSGGPLINVAGEVIGINTAIYSPTRAFSGIGFAIPIDRAKESFPDFVEVTPPATRKLMEIVPGITQGRLRPVAAFRGVQRGNPPCVSGPLLRQAANVMNGPWLGIRGTTVDSVTRDSRGLPMSRGVCIDEVSLDSPAWSAGLQSGDVILRVNDRIVKDEQALAGFLAAVGPGETVKLTIFRDGNRLVFSPLRDGGPATGREGRGGSAPRTAAVPTAPVAPFDPANVNPPGLTGALKGGELGVGEMEALGMGVENLAPEWRIAFKIPDNVKRGVIVSEIGGVAADSGLLPGDVIQSVGRQPVNNIADYLIAMGKVDLNKGVSLGVNRQGKPFTLKLKNGV
ncbi:trypsin-like peptidase domain-containing protein [Verrucomicrobiota bacterium]